MTSEPSPPSKTGLVAGDHLGPYRIVGLLGAGGMGEVYRAHDPRLARDVALKIMRRPTASADQIARFTREARAAGSLNHPNIVAVHDVGTEGGVPYVVTELLEGETLADRLRRGPLQYRKAVEYGVQMAQALDAAHGKGIWHRDVKPANAFITEGGQGRIKLLDFGVAKLSEEHWKGRSEAETSSATETGQIHGTPGYMSPEQVLDQAVDHRTDIFALGAVLYEMFTGARAFQCPSAHETMNAVVHADPQDPLAICPTLSPLAASVVRRCLEKNREERFQSARDLAFNLQRLNDPSTGPHPSPASRPPNLLRMLLTAVALVGALAAAAWLLRPTSVSPTFEQLTFHRGRIGGARFAFGGTAVIYSEASQRHELQISRLDLGGGRPSAQKLGQFALGTDILAAARTGELALLLTPQFVQGERFVGTLGRAPLDGAPRSAGENIEYADWTPGGELVVVHSTGTISGGSQIEYPGGEAPLYKTDKLIGFLRVSPDGKRVAFIEEQGRRRGGPSGIVAVVDLKGKVTPLTKDWESARGLAWSPNSEEIWFTAGETGGRRELRAVTLNGKDRIVFSSPGSLTVWDIAANGDILLTRDEERRTVVAKPPDEDTERDLSWFDQSGVVAISDDGRTVLCGDRFGVYTRKTDGSDPIHILDDGWADDLSPDGKTVLGTIDSGHKLVFRPEGAAAPRPVPAGGIAEYSGAWWFPDMRNVLFAGRLNGEGKLRSYMQDIHGGQPKPITPPGQAGVAISPDGSLIAGVGTKEGIPVWRVEDGKASFVRGGLPGERPVAWSEDGKLWLFRRGEIPANIYKLDIKSGGRELWRQPLSPPDSAGVYSIIEFHITPDGRAYTYSYSRLLSQLYLVRGLR